MSKNKQSFMEGALILTIAVAVVKIIGAIYKIPMNNIIGIEGSGYYSTAFTLYNMIYAITVTGFPVAIARIVSGFASEGRYIDIKRVRRISSALFFVLGLIGTAALLLLARPYVELQKTPLAYYGVLAVTPALIFCCMMATYRGYTQGMRNMTPTAMSQIVEVIFKASSGIVLCYWARAHFANEYQLYGTVLGEALGESAAQSTVQALAAAGAMLGISISTLCGFLFLFIRQRVKGDGISREMVAASPRPYSGKHLLKTILLIGIPIALGQAVINLTDMFSEFILKDRLFSLFANSGELVFASHGGLLEQMGYALEHTEQNYQALASVLFGAYNLGLPVYLMIPTITGSFSTSALPHISAAWTSGDKSALKSNIESPLRLTMLVAAPAGCGIVALAGPIMTLLFGRGEDPLKAVMATPMMTILGVAVIFVALSGPLTAMLQGVGRVRTTVVLLVIGCAVKLGVNYFVIGVPSLNVKGMPFGTLSCYILIVAASLIVLSKTVGFHLDYVGAMVKPLFAGVFCGVFARLGYNVANLAFSSNISTILAIAFAAVVYIVALGLLKAITREDVLQLPGGKKIAQILEKLHFIR